MLYAYYTHTRVVRDAAGSKRARQLLVNSSPPRAHNIIIIVMMYVIIIVIIHVFYKSFPLSASSSVSVPPSFHVMYICVRVTHSRSLTLFSLAAYYIPEDRTRRVTRCNLLLPPWHYCCYYYCRAAVVHRSNTYYYDVGTIETICRSRGNEFWRVSVAARRRSFIIFCDGHGKHCKTIVTTRYKRST